MRIIEIAPLDNGAHRNQSYPGFVPVGWAIIAEAVELENFPFGNFEVEERYGNGVLYMKEDSWIPGVMPEPGPTPEPEEEASVWDELDAAYQEGVNSAYDQ